MRMKMTNNDMILFHIFGWQFIMSWSHVSFNIHIMRMKINISFPALCSLSIHTIDWFPNRVNQTQMNE